MAVIATNTIEQRCSSLGEHRQLLVNIELNNSCAHTKVCGQTCYLNVVSPVGKAPLGPELVLAAAREVIRRGEFVRHFVMPGKEVFETPDLLLGVLDEFHTAPIQSRPGTISIITASATGLQRYASRLVETPLSAVNISMDTAGSGLRSPRNNGPLLAAALRLKELGGTEVIGVNTVLTEDNLADAVQIGKHLQSAGIDQWTLGPLLRPVNGRMESVLSAGQLRVMIDRVRQEFGGSDLGIVVDLDLPLFSGLVEVPGVFAAGKYRWRYEYELPDAPNIMLEAGNPAEGYFFRMDWAGQLLSREDYRRISSPASYGQYSPGAIESLIQKLRSQRPEPAVVE